MRFTIATLVALAGAAVAQTANFNVIMKPTEGTKVPAGEAYQIEWDSTAAYADQTVTLSLLGGASPQTLQILNVIKANVSSSAGSYNWAVDSTLGSLATYGIKIALDTDADIFQYSFPFTISASSAASASSSAPASSAASSAAAVSSSAATTAASSAATSAAPSAASSVSVASSAASSVASAATTAAPTSVAAATTSAASSAAAAVTTLTSTTKSSNATVASTKTASAGLTTPSTVTTSGSSALQAGSLFALLGLVAAAAL